MENLNLEVLTFEELETIEGGMNAYEAGKLAAQGVKVGLMMVGIAALFLS